jgi:hypothetical protein
MFSGFGHYDKITEINELGKESLILAQGFRGSSS